MRLSWMAPYSQERCPQAVASEEKQLLQPLLEVGVDMSTARCDLCVDRQWCLGQADCQTGWPSFFGPS